MTYPVAKPSQDRLNFDELIRDAIAVLIKRGEIKLREKTDIRNRKALLFSRPLITHQAKDRAIASKVR